MNRVFSLLRMIAGLAYMAVAVAVFLVLCTMLLPFRSARIRVCNVFGHITGPLILWISGARLEGVDWDRLKRSYPAIYVSNHTSVLDIFLGIWLAPIGVCGVAKKEVVWYPFFGQLYLLSGHLRLDRQNRDRAVDALKRIADEVRLHNLGIWIWPEGTRSRDGRLMPFKKGFAHLALATGLPIVPVVVSGGHRAWQKGSMEIVPSTLHVQVLEPIPTTGWTNETVEAHVDEVHEAFVGALPADQRPLVNQSAVKIPA
jgi:1-acyl-sn-glycerol-3-phosphate acyltransferase